jgi:hypothetical protein
MKKFLSLAMLAMLVLAPSAARTQTSTNMIGVGPHGYDFLIGSWTCTNTTPTPMAGPSVSKFTASRSNQGSSLVIRTSGKNFDSTSYLTYVPAAKTWWTPSAFADGSYETESTTQSGKKVVFSGSYFNAASGKTTQVRDTFVQPSIATYTDLGEYQAGGVWKKQYNITCTKT